jgi:hypothetical protein
VYQMIAVEIGLALFTFGGEEGAQLLLRRTVDRAGEMNDGKRR